MCIIYIPGKDAREKFLHDEKKLGWPRIYLRDGVPGMSIEQQREMIVAAGFELPEEHMLFVDRLSKAAVKRRDSSMLKKREDVIRPLHEGETIVLAGLRVFDWPMSGIARCLLVAAQHKANVFCCDTRTLYAADMPGPALLEALASAEEAHRRGAAKDRQMRATTAAQRKKDRATNRALDKIRDRWHDRAHDTDALLAEAKLSRRTVYNKLGARFADEPGIEHA